MYKKYSGTGFLFSGSVLFLNILIAAGVGAQQVENGYKIKTVVIDAGHGGKDPGSLGKQSKEKDIALAIALKTGSYIEKNLSDVKVIYTRKTDVFVPLHQRADIANTNKADLFVSIHVNGNESYTIDGTETLVLGMHRAGENFEVAKKENSVILLEDDYKERYEGFDPNSPESYQSFSLMQDLYFKKSIEFAGLVQEQFRERARRKDRSVRQQGLLVLAQTSMPGVLIETGFITNPDEEKYLVTDSGQDYISSAIYRAFRDYKGLVESNINYVLATDTGKAEGAFDTAEMTRTAQANADNVQQPLTTGSERKIEFKVQITAASKPITLDSHIFKDLDHIAEYHVGNLYKYAVGSNGTFEEAIIYSRDIKEKFPDAFIIAVKQDTIIPLDQALKEIQSLKNKN